MCKCINALLKLILWLFSAVVFILGLVLIILPVSLFNAETFEQVINFGEQLLSEGDFSKFTWLLVPFGIILIIVSYIGCSSAHSGHKFTKTIFFVINGGVSVALFVIGVYILLYVDSKGDLDEALSNYTLVTNETVNENFSSDIGYEATFHCCGIFTPGENPTPRNAPKCYNWEDNKPQGCFCRLEEGVDGCVPIGEADKSCDLSGQGDFDGIYIEGCFVHIRDQFNGFIVGLAAVAILASLATGVAGSMACWLCCCDGIEK